MKLIPAELIRNPDGTPLVNAKRTTSTVKQVVGMGHMSHTVGSNTRNLASSTTHSTGLIRSISPKRINLEKTQCDEKQIA